MIHLYENFYACMAGSENKKNRPDFKGRFINKKYLLLIQIFKSCYIV